MDAANDAVQKHVVLVFVMKIVAQVAAIVVVDNNKGDGKPSPHGL
jgi:hypothetical protein